MNFDYRKFSWFRFWAIASDLVMPIAILLLAVLIADVSPWFYIGAGVLITLVLSAAVIAAYLEGHFGINQRKDDHGVEK